MIISKAAATLFVLAFPVVTIMHGTSGNDVLVGTQDRDYIFGHDGDDNLDGGGGNDRCFGGDGDDWVTDYGDGNDVMFGGKGGDWIFPGVGNDWLFGGSGEDQLDLYTDVEFFAPQPCAVNASGYDVVYGGSGDDVVQWASGTVYFDFIPTATPSCVHAGSGYVHGGSGWDTVFVGVGNFKAREVDYVLEPGVFSGTYLLTSLETGAELYLRGCEQVVFTDATITL